MSFVSLCELKKNLNIVVIGDVDEVAKAPRSAPAILTARFVAGDDWAPKPDQQEAAPSSASVAKKKLPKELRKIAKLTDVDDMVLVGSGGFGQVFLATNSAKPGEKFAIKVANIYQAQHKQMLEQEARLMAGLSGKPGFLDFYGNGFIKASSRRATPDRFVIKMEFVPFNLLEYAEKALAMGTKPTLELLRRLFKHLVDACKFLHSKCIVHHDIKAENVMVQTPTGRGLNDTEDLDAELRQSTFKLIDFGLVEHVKPGYQEFGVSRHRAGTKNFMSMDKFHCCFHDARLYNPYAADAFAVGYTMYCVADTQGYFEMQRRKGSCAAWISVLPHLEQAYLNGNLGQLRDTRLLFILQYLLADDKEPLLAKIQDDSY